MSVENKITCPYDWFCGKSFAIDSLSAHDKEFVESAIPKGMEFMFISCPYCETRFQFNPQIFLSTPMIENPNKSKEDVKLTEDESISILNKEQSVYPDYYIQFLTEKKSRAEIKTDRKEDAFKLYKLDELAETISIDHQKVIRAKELTIYAKSLREVGYENVSVEKAALQFSLEWLSEGLTIGYENTQILFIDNDLNLWIFYADGTNDIRQTSLQLNDIIK